MDRLEVNPLYRDALAELGLTRAEDFLRLSGVIWCGHPDRNVAHVTLMPPAPSKRHLPSPLGGEGPGVRGLKLPESSPPSPQPSPPRGEGAVAFLNAFLKKEHRVPWRDRLANALAGFGFVSKSLREAHFLRDVAQTGVGCPEVMAAGEHQQRAFLLIREIDHGVDLRTFLAQETGASPRSELARKLGQTIGEMHKRGIVHRDLFSKHVLVHIDAQGELTCDFLDWQRSQRMGGVSWRECYRELACLDATLADNLCSVRERLLCLRAYLRSHGGAQKFSRAARTIRQLANRLLQKRYVREMRQTPLPAGEQNLVWLDGEAVCVTKQFLEVVESGKRAERVFTAEPNRPVARPGRTLQLLDELQNHAQAQCRQIIRIDDGRPLDAVLVRRQESRFWSWLWRSIRRRRFASKELSLAATLFRLERYGVPVPRLFAVGQQFTLPWRVHSFILLEHAPLPTLAEWRKQNVDSNRERGVLAQSAMHLQRIHEAGYSVAKSRDPLDIFAVNSDDDGRQTVVLRDPAALQRTGKAK